MIYLPPQGVMHPNQVMRLCWGVSLNPFESQGIDIVDPFSGLDLSYVDDGA